MGGSLFSLASLKRHRAIATGHARQKAAILVPGETALDFRPLRFRAGISESGKLRAIGEGIAPDEGEAERQTHAFDRRIALESIVLQTRRSFGDLIVFRG